MHMMTCQILVLGRNTKDVTDSKVTQIYTNSQLSTPGAPTHTSQQSTQSLSTISTTQLANLLKLN